MPRRKGQRAARYIRSSAPTDDKSRAYRSELSIVDIRGLAWNAVQGSSQSYEILEAQNKKLAKLANSRMRALKSAGLDMFAYDRAITYLENNDLKRFSTKFASQDDFKGMVDQLSELVAFINSKTSTVAGAKKALDEKLDKISEYTGTEYTQSQRQNLGRLLGTDSISTLLRDIRGNSSEVIEALEDISLTSLDTQRVTEIVDRYLVGWTPWSNTPWVFRSQEMNYDELIDALRDLYEENI